ncbi:sulfite exporter TauE/SafE family protein [Litchfieldella qijiaojingensis]|nr:sulfite exporter TauE/SafE family protein [Halomonas qijiaojingensis]
MNGLSPGLILLLISTFLIAGLVKGVTGMGLPTVAMGLLGTAMSPVTAAAMLVVPSFVTNVWQLIAGPAKTRLVRRLWPMMLCILLGTTLGSALLVRADPVWSSVALGVALIAYAGYALFSPSLSVPPRMEPWLSPIIGIMTGAITGATGVFVIPAVPYLQSLRLDRDELVQALGLSFTVSTIALAVGLVLHSAFHVGQMSLSALAIVPALVGMWLGQKIRNRISPGGFRLCFLVFLVVLGLDLALRPLLT